VIGTGSYGSVCEAHDSERDHLVAVKRVRHLFDDLIDCKRILREVAILSRLRHEFIVQIHDVVSAGSRDSFDELYIVMEVCDSDLKKLCRTDVTLSPLHINTLAYNLLVGVNYLHSASIYHRDLKPANCLVNQDCSVKICDFGLSRALGTEADQMEATMTNLPSGSSRPSKRHLTGHVVTRWYRAPELILLQENYTQAIDLWSVGCIYAELLGMLEGKRLEDRGPLFPGTSCFPLSPDSKHKERNGNRVNHDQLNMIFNIIGTPTEEELAEIHRDDAKRYLACFAKRTGDGLRSKFPNIEADSLDFLQRLLRFSPKERLTVRESLSHPLFSELRDPSRETVAPGPVVLDFEKEPDLDEALLRKYFIREMRTYGNGQGDEDRFRKLGS